MELKNYQVDAVEELVAKAKKLLDYPGSKRLILKAPTGSGKTIMMAVYQILLAGRKRKAGRSF